MLGAEDPLPRPPRRILVAGISGVGKSTLARGIAARSGIPHTEIDGLFHGPDWTPRPEFETEVELLTRSPQWVTEWQYAPVRQLLAERADTLLWLDYPIALAMSRVIRRTLRRRMINEELWNGNREPPLRTFFTDPEHIVRWAWQHRHVYAERLTELQRTAPHLAIVRLRTPRDAERWLDQTFGASTAPPKRRSREA